MLTNARFAGPVPPDSAEDPGDTLVLRGTLDRESLHLGVVVLPDQPSRLGWLADYLARTEGSGIVYCLTVAATEQVADHLRSRGLTVAAYSGRTVGCPACSNSVALLLNWLA